MSDMSFNLPVIISEWNVKFKPFPFMKRRGLKHFLATNLIESSTSFSNGNLKEFKEQKFEYTLPVDTTYDVDGPGMDMLRNYYIHKKKSWSFPEIEKIDEYIVYLPYAVGENKGGIYLIEHTTGLKKKIKYKDKIYKILKGDVYL